VPCISKENRCRQTVCHAVLPIVAIDAGDGMFAKQRYGRWLLGLAGLLLAAGCCAPSQIGVAPPTVLSVSPAGGVNGVCPTATLTAVFSEAMNPTTITASSFTLSGPGAVADAGKVSYTAATHTALFTPALALAVNATYTATISTAVKDQYGNSLAQSFVWSFTTAANGCTPPPVVNSVSPAAGATGICPNATVVATFDEAMNATTINASTFTLSPGVTGTITHNAANTVFTLTPSSSLAVSRTYTATLTTGVQDSFGNALANPYVSSFATAANGCNPPPTVVSVTPVLGAAGVCPNQLISAVFSEAMNPATVDGTTFTVTGGGGTAVAGTVSYSAGNDTAYFSPSASLPLNTTYTATITTGVQDLFGNNLAANHAWMFATGANTCQAPAAPVSVTPPNGAAGVCPTTVVAATFGQAMNPATINAASFTLMGPGNAPVAGTVSHDSTNKIYSFTPGADLALLTTYTATITTGAQDPYGNALASNYVWTFTTGASTCAPNGMPMVISVSPANGAMGVCANTAVSATFSEAMDPATINNSTFTLSPAVPGTVTLDATGKIAVYTPAANLALNTLYTATITTGAKDLAGTALPANYVWTFTTAALACQQAIALGTAAQFEVLAGSTVTNTGPTIITGGNLGLSPGTAVTGFPPGTLIAPAVMEISNSIAAQAELDLTIAYNDAASLPNGAALPADLAGLTLTPGLYTNATTVMLSAGNLTLDGQGNANAVFIFQVGSTLTTLGSTQIVLTGGAQAANVFWQVGSSATLGTSSVFEGTILSLQSISLNTGATLVGRALARNGQVTLEANAVTAP
jgi:hypothetical protein